ncbi:hypothetical protein ACVIHI_007978 [Bradyrhizobium sp. USDA 4524]
MTMKGRSTTRQWLRLQGEYDRIQKRLHAMYLDKLDGRIDGDFFDRTSAEWREEQATLLRELSFHQAADQSYLEDGIRLLDLAQRALEIFDKRSAIEKRWLLKFALSNCTWKEGQLSATFRQPFDLIAKFDAPPFDPNGGGMRIPAERSNWWAWQDSNLQPDRYERTALTIELQAPLLRWRRGIVYNLSGAPARLSHASAPALRTFPQVFLSVL